MRAFARDIGITPQHLHYILKGQSGISYEKVLKIVGSFNLNKQAQKKFLLTVSGSHDRSAVTRQLATEKLKSLTSAEDEQLLAIEKLDLISEWYYLPIILALDVYESTDALSIAQKLGLSKTTIRMALNKLVNSGFIEKDGKFYKRSAKHQALHAENNSSLKKLYAEMMKQSLKTIELNEKLRSFSFILTTISENEMDFAVEQINLFRKKMGRQLAEQTINPDRIYALSIQFFPISKVSE